MGRVSLLRQEIEFRQGTFDQQVQEYSRSSLSLLQQLPIIADLYSVLVNKMIR